MGELHGPKPERREQQQQSSSEKPLRQAGNVSSALGVGPGSSIKLHHSFARIAPSHKGPHPISTPPPPVSILPHLPLSFHPPDCTSLVGLSGSIPGSGDGEAELSAPTGATACVLGIWVEHHGWGRGPPAVRTFGFQPFAGPARELRNPARRSKSPIQYRINRGWQTIVFKGAVLVTVTPIAAAARPPASSSASSPTPSSGLQPPLLAQAQVAGLASGSDGGQRPMSHRNTGLVEGPRVKAKPPPPVFDPLVAASLDMGGAPHQVTGVTHQATTGVTHQVTTGVTHQAAGHQAHLDASSANQGTGVTHQATTGVTQQAVGHQATGVAQAQQSAEQPVQFGGVPQQVQPVSGGVCQLGLVKKGSVWGLGDPARCSVALAAVGVFYQAALEHSQVRWTGDGRSPCTSPRRGCRWSRLDWCWPRVYRCKDRATPKVSESPRLRSRLSWHMPIWNAYLPGAQQQTQWWWSGTWHWASPSQTWDSWASWAPPSETWSHEPPPAASWAPPSETWSNEPPPAVIRVQLI